MTNLPIVGKLFERSAPGSKSTETNLSKQDIEKLAALFQALERATREHSDDVRKEHSDAVQAQIKELQEKLAKLKPLARSSEDPALKAVNTKLQNLKSKNRELLGLDREEHATDNIRAEIENFHQKLQTLKSTARTPDDPALRVTRQHLVDAQQRLQALRASTEQLEPQPAPVPPAVRRGGSFRTESPAPATPAVPSHPDAPPRPVAPVAPERSRSESSERDGLKGIAKPDIDLELRIEKAKKEIRELDQPHPRSRLENIERDDLRGIEKTDIDLERRMEKAKQEIREFEQHRTPRPKSERSPQTMRRIEIVRPERSRPEIPAVPSLPDAPPQPVAPVVPVAPLPTPNQGPHIPLPPPTPSIPPLPTAPIPLLPSAPPGLGGIGIFDDGAGREEEPVGSAVLQVVLAPDGKTFATACDDGVIRIYDVATQKVVRELKETATFVAVSTDVIDGRKVEHGIASSLPDQRIWTIAYQPDGKTLASAGGDFDDHEHPADITLWDVPSGKVKTKLKGHAHTIFTLAISPDGKRLVSGGFDKSIKMWDLTTNSLIKAVDGHFEQESGEDHPVRSIAWNPDGNSFASVGFDGRLKITGNDGRPIQAMNFPEKDDDEPVGLNSVVYARDGKTLIVGGGAKAHILTWKDQKAHLLKSLEFPEQRLLTVAISPDGKSIAAGGGDYGNTLILRTWELDSSLETRTLIEPGEWIESLVYSPDGHTLIAGGGVAHKPGFITLWDLSSKPQAQTPTVRRRTD